MRHKGIFVWAALLLTSAVSCGKKEVEYNHIVPTPFSAHYYDSHYTGHDVPADGSAAGVTVRIRPGMAGRFGSEGYRLKVGEGNIMAEASDSIGIFYAMQTLRQLKDSFGIRCAVIEDFPRFAYRGIHVDVSRHFFSIGEIRKILREMAFYKFNNLHWHLTDGGGWRIEIDSYPLLIQKGAWRTEKDWDNWILHGMKFCDADTPGAYGGYYTKEEIREIVRYADSLHINVIPEFELPAHSEAVFSAYPELNCTNSSAGNGEFCPANEEFYRFAEGVLTEIMELFPSKVIHIGADEARKTAWKTCPDCNALMKMEGMLSYDDLQCHAVSRIQKFLLSHGRIMAGWDEILKNDDLAEGTLVYSYRGQQGGIEAANRGLKAVMTPGEVLYFDWYQAEPAKEQKAMYGYSPLKKMYSFEPQPVTEVLSSFNQALIKGSVQSIDTIGFILPGNAGNVYGVQGCSWAEYIPDENHLEYMMFPRLLAVSELAWSKTEKDWNNFKLRVNSHIPGLRSRGLNVYDLHDGPYITAKACENGFSELSLDCENAAAQIRYTLDGSTPDASSKLWTGEPVRISEKSVVKAAAFVGGHQVSYLREAEIVPGEDLVFWYPFNN